MPLLGAHVSTAGGVSTAFARGAAIGCDALQVFVKNANTWRAKALDPAEAAAFHAAHAATPGPSAPAPLRVVAHAGYLINLCSPKVDVHEKSHTALIDELERCEALGIPGLVLHPGAHLGEGEEAGIDGVARALDAVHAAMPSGRARVLLENTAGQGTVLGARLPQLAAIVARVDAPDRVGICLDTCHAFAAGYDLRDDDAYRAFMDEVEATVTLARVAAVHLNDSQFGLGAGKDRHASIGAGELGVGAFERWLADPRWGDVPMLLETPMGDDGLGHARDLVTLRAL
ncbi:MAG: deoxyribonuclease IV [bacterium]|jgi:deoxyribonuclease IV|nr:deoxyribonuclease IV [bacterium]